MVAGYRFIRVDGKKIAEHRHVVEQREGRKLARNEIVHHVDGNPLNNDPDNLVILTRSEHQRLHHMGAKQRRWTVEEEDRAVELENAGMTMMQVTKVLGRSISSVGDHLRKRRKKVTFSPSLPLRVR